MPTIADPPALGRRYRSECNPDGTFNVRDVPIFAETEKRLGEKVVGFDKDWLDSAVSRAATRASEGYFSPLRIRHLGSRVEPMHAGKAWPRRVARSVIDGEVVWTVFGDYLEVPAAAFDLMRRGELPYVSIEAFDYTEGLIDAVSLLDASDGPPHIPFPLFRAADPAADAALFAKAFTPRVNPKDVEPRGGVVACFAFKDHRAALARFDSMPDDPNKKPDEPKAEKKPAEGGADEGAKKIVDAILSSDGLRTAIEAQVKTMLAEIAGGGAKKPETGAPHDQPKENAMSMSKEVSESLVKMQGELDGLKSLEAARKSDATIVEAADGVISRLARFGLGVEDRPRLVKMAKDHGLGALSVYEETVKKHGTEAPPTPQAVAASVAGGQADPSLPKEVLAYTGDPGRLATAIKCSKDYDALRARGRLSTVSLESHLRTHVGAV